MEDTKDRLFPIVFMESELSEYRLLLLIVLIEILAFKRRKNSFASIHTKGNKSPLRNTPAAILLCVAES